MMNYRTKLIFGLVIPDMVKKFKGTRPCQGAENQGFWAADVGSRRAGVCVGVRGCLARRRHLPDRHVGQERVSLKRYSEAIQSRRFGDA